MKDKKTKTSVRSPKYRTQRADVFSYHSNRNRPESDGSQQRQDVTDKKPVSKQNRFSHIPTYIALIATLASCFYASLLSTNSPKIAQLSSNSSSILRGDEEYQEGVAEILSRSVLNRSKLTIDTDDVARQIKEKYTEIGTVVVTIPLVSRRPVVQISPATPMLSVNSGSRSYAVSEEGRALIGISELSDEVKNSLIRVNDTLEIDFKPGDYVLPKNTIGFIKEVKDQLEDKGQRIETITLPAVANELHIKVEGQPYIIKFNLQNDAMQQVGSYLAITESFSNGQTPAKEYIDVRVDGRVYYK